MEWFNPEDLTNKITPDTLPEIVRDLLLASTREYKDFKIPLSSLNGTFGFDAIFEVDNNFEHTYIPSGKFICEFGAAKGTKSKADKDYIKRSQIGTNDITYVFMTNHVFNKADEWISEKKADKSFPWKDLKCIERDRLYEWFQRCPEVATKWAERWGFKSKGLYSITELWRKWYIACKNEVPLELIRALGTDNNKKILDFLESSDKNFLVTASSVDEARLYVSSVFLLADKEESNIDNEKIANRIVCADTSEAFEHILNHGFSPNIIITPLQDGSLINQATEKEIKIIQVLHKNYTPEQVKIELPIRINNSIFWDTLRNLEFEPEKISKWQNDSGRNITSLRYILAKEPPLWAKVISPSLLAALLVGGWSSNSEDDRNTMVTLSGKNSYDDFIEELQQSILCENSPVQYEEPSFRIISSYSAYPVIADKIIIRPELLNKFTDICINILSKYDKINTLNLGEQISASFAGVSNSFSDIIRMSLADSLIHLSIILKDKNKSHIIDNIVEKVIGTDINQWNSNRPFLDELAEASPIAFLNALEKSYEINKEDFHTLVNTTDIFMNGTGVYTSILSTLELIAWDENFLERVSKVLIKLHSSWGEVKDNYTNSAIDSFSKIYCLWFPQTFASTEKREAILKQLTEDNPDILWEVLMKLLLLGKSMNIFPTRKPKYKLPFEDCKELLHSEVQKSNEIILDLLVSIINGNSEKNKVLLDKVIRNGYSLDLCQELYNYMENIPNSEEEKLNLWDNIREQIKFINNHPNTVREEHKEKLEKIYNKITPKDFIMAKGYYFYDTEHILEYKGYGHDKGFIPFIESKQEEIISEIFIKNNSAKMLFELMNFISKRILNIGKEDNYHDLDFAGQKIFRYIAKNANSQDEYNNFFENCIHNNINSQFIRGIIREYVEIHSSTRLTETFDYFYSFEKKVFEIYLEEVKIMEEEIFFIESKDNIVQKHFWGYSSIRIFKDYTNQEYIINKLVEFEQYETAFKLVSLFYKNIENFELLNNVLDGHINYIISKPNPNFKMHLLQEFFSRLYEIPNKNLEILARLEFKFYHLLEESKHTYLYMYIAENPQFFIELVSYFYDLPNEKESDTMRDENVQSRAKQCYRIVSTISKNYSGILNAFRVNDKLDGEKLTTWVNDSLAEAKKKGCYNITLNLIGKHLSCSGVDIDGAWPEIPIRKILAHDEMDKLREAYILGYSNRSNSWWGSMINHHQGIIRNVQSNIDKLAPSDKELITLLESYIEKLNRDIENEIASKRLEDMKI